MDFLKTVFNKQEAIIDSFYRRAEDTLGINEKTMELLAKKMTEMIQDVAPIFESLGIENLPTYKITDASQIEWGVEVHSKTIKNMLSSTESLESIPKYSDLLAKTFQYAKSLSTNLIMLLDKSKMEPAVFIYNFYSTLKNNLNLWTSNEKITINIEGDDYEMSNASITEFIEKIKEIDDELKNLKLETSEQKKELNQLKQDFSDYTKHLEEDPLETLKNQPIKSFGERLKNFGIELGVKATLIALDHYSGQ